MSDHSLDPDQIPQDGSDILPSYILINPNLPAHKVVPGLLEEASRYLSERETTVVVLDKLGNLVNEQINSIRSIVTRINTGGVPIYVFVKHEHGIYPRYPYDTLIVDLRNKRYILSPSHLRHLKQNLNELLNFGKEG